MANRVSMKDIAKKVGVSKNTVSMVLRGMPGISEQTRNIIFETAEQMGYVFPKADDKCTRLSPSKNICLIMSRSTRDSIGFFSNIQFGIESEARRNNISTIIHYYTDEEGGFETPLCIKEGLVSGIITLGRISEADINTILEYRLPIIMVDHYFDLLKTDYVLTDNQSGAFTAVQYLIKCGHRKIGFIGDIRSSPSFYDRFNGFLKALTVQGIPYDALCCITNKSLEAMVENDMSAAISEFEALSMLPTAFFCCNDAEAIATFKVLTIMGIKVPEEVSLIGFDDIESAKNTIPGLTTMRVEKEFMGIRAVRKLIEMMERTSSPEEKILLPAVLIERQSVMRIGI